MSKRLISTDPVTGLMTWHDYDPQTDETYIGYEADASPIIELNKAMQNDEQFSRDGIKDGFWLYASIPVGVQMKWLIEDGIDILKKEHGPRISAKLESPEYRYLKTTTGHHRFK